MFIHIMYNVDSNDSSRQGGGVGCRDGCVAHQPGGYHHHHYHYHRHHHFIIIIIIIIVVVVVSRLTYLNLKPFWSYV